MIHHHNLIHFINFFSNTNSMSELLIKLLIRSSTSLFTLFNSVKIFSLPVFPTVLTHLFLLLFKSMPIFFSNCSTSVLKLWMRESLQIWQSNISIIVIISIFDYMSVTIKLRFYNEIIRRIFHHFINNIKVTTENIFNRLINLRKIKRSC